MASGNACGRFAKAGSPGETANCVTKFPHTTAAVTALPVPGAAQAVALGKEKRIPVRVSGALLQLQSFKIQRPGVCDGPEGSTSDDHPS
jgi:hypothetical protein